MSNKLTIIKVLPKDGPSPSAEDLKRWQQIFAENKMSMEEAVATGEIEVEVIPEAESEHTITLVKVGSENYSPSMEDLETWRQVFAEPSVDPDFKIFIHPAVEIQIIPIGKIVNIE